MVYHIFIFIFNLFILNSHFLLILDYHALTLSLCLKTLLLETLDHKTISRAGIFIAIEKNSLYGSND